MPVAADYTAMIAPIVAIAAFVIGWNYLVARVSGRPWRHALGMAFTFTAVALLYGTAGLIGYALPLHNPFIDGPAARVGHVVWPEVWMASAMALGSGVFWWLALRQPARFGIHTEPRPGRWT